MANTPSYFQRVGFFTFIGVFLLLFGWSWLKGFSLLHPPQEFTVEFHDIAGLNNNAPVNINGVRVGTVAKIELKRKGLVYVHLKINTEEIRGVPKGSVFTIQTLGLVGAKYMEITLPEQEITDSTVLCSDASGEPEKGQDPVRTELIVNKMATNIGSIDFAGIANDVKAKMERMAVAADSVSQTSKKFGDAAADAKSAAHNADVFWTRQEFV